MLNRMAPRCKLIASHQLERPAPSCLHLNKGSSFPAPFFNCLIPDWIGFTIGYVSTALSTNFGQPETGPACRFPFCFLNISKRTIQLKVRVRTKASQDIFVGFNPLTIISGQSYISELIAQHSHFSDDRSSWMDGWMDLLVGTGGMRFDAMAKFKPKQPRRPFPSI